MRTIDLVCAEERLPLVRLLQTHLKLLDINLRVHEVMPDPPTPRAVLIPHAGLPATLPGVEWAALYFDDTPPHPAVKHHFRIPTWPARSSDHDVRRLARFLQQPLLEQGAGGQRDDARRRKPRTPSERLRDNAQGLTVALLLAAMVVLLATTTSQNTSSAGNEEVAEQTYERIEQPAAAPGSRRSGPEPVNRRELQPPVSEYVTAAPDPSLAADAPLRAARHPGLDCRSPWLAPADPAGPYGCSVRRGFL